MTPRATTGMAAASRVDRSCSRSRCSSRCFPSRGRHQRHGDRHADRRRDGLPLCEQTVESVAGALPGVVAVDADRESQSATVTYDPSRVDVDAVVAHLNEQTYYEVSTAEDRPVTAADAAPATGDAARAGTSSAVGAAAIGMVVLGAGLVAWRARRRNAID